jgi:hypothetical protein
MDILIQYVLAFLAGALVKAVDYLEDERKTSGAVKIPLAIGYGFLIGYLISTASFSVLFLAALVAQVFARKIDTLSHRLGFLVAILSPLYFGFHSFDIPLFAAFLFLAFLDEMDYIGVLRPFNRYRPFLKLGSLIPAIGGVWDYFIGIMAFDVGYELVRAVLRMAGGRRPAGAEAPETGRPQSAPAPPQKPLVSKEQGKPAKPRKARRKKQ